MVDGWDPYESEPKTDGSASTIALDSMNTAVLRGRKARQDKAAKLIPRSRPATAEASASAPADPQDTRASLTQEPENEAAPEPAEADPSAA
ncbi:hypothetical protein ACH4JS_34995 [Streptomyces sp. NPDC017638]|uniref:hypothetical protein n=1 Tax=Streptomyces sp. NPDC017638 TaxID=3365004 RepID=UPI0037AD793E